MGSPKGPPVTIYAWVSTARLDCERQGAELEAFAARVGYRVVEVFRETASGRKDTRPERRKVLTLTTRREIDAVLVTELSRCGRSTPDLFSTLAELAGGGVSLRALNGFDVDLSTANGRTMVTLLSEVAVFAADLLAERVRSGLTRSEQGQNSWPQER